MRKAFLVIGSVVVFAATAEAKEITTCGQLVPAGEVGILQQDLVCPTYPGVVLESGAMLDLNGLSLTVWDAGPPGVYPAAIQAGWRSAVVSTAAEPGLVIGVTGDGALKVGVSGAHLRVDNVSVAGDFPNQAIYSQRKLVARNVTVTRSTPGNLQTCGLCSDGNIKVENVIVDGYGRGLGATKRLKGTNVAVTGSFVAGITATKGLRGENIVASGNGIGVFTCGAARLSESNVTGNSTADVVSRRKPTLRNTVCVASRRTDLRSCEILSEPWGVCTGD